MELRFPVDYYEMKARYAPGLLLALPVLLTFWTCFGPEVKEISGLISGLFSAVVVYGLSAVVRAMGKRLEPKLIKKWGGLPSTLIVSSADQTIGPDVKKQYLQAAADHLKLPVPSLTDETADPRRAAEMLDQVFTRIKGIIRQKDRHGLWSIANADYGFARNLYGSRIVWLILCLLGVATCSTFLYTRPCNLFLVGLISNGLCLVACITLGWLLLPKYTRQVAFRYAESAWESFYVIAAEKPTKRD
jgi:hypothetical protein